MGKGSKYRPVDKKKYDVNYERIFGVKELKLWRPECEQQDDTVIQSQSLKDNQHQAEDTGGDGKNIGSGI